MAEKIIRQTNFLAGEIGARLIGARDTKVYQAAARDMINMFPSEIGGVRLLKQYQKVEDAFKEPPLNHLTLKDGNYIMISKRYLWIVRREPILDPSYALPGGDIKWVPGSELIIKEIEHKIEDIDTEGNAHPTLGKDVRLSVIEDRLFVMDTPFEGSTITNTHTFILSKAIASDYYSEIIKEADGAWWNTVELPVKNRKTIGIDIYKRVKYTETDSSGNPVEIEKIISVHSDKTPDLSLGDAGEILYGRSKIHLRRLYTEYQAGLTKDDIGFDEGDGQIAPGQYFGVLKQFFENTADDESYILGNKNITLGTKSTDGKYSSSPNYIIRLISTGTIDKVSVFTHGKLIDVRNSTKDVGVLQSRMYLITKDKIYFSEVLKHENFRNEPGEGKPFYIEPAAINGVIPDMFGAIANRGLFILTSMGVYVLGYSESLSAVGTIITIGTDVIPTREATIVNSTLFFVDRTYGHLYAMSPEEENSTNVTETFKTVEVEKYLANRSRNSMAVVDIDGRKFLAVLDKFSSDIQIYDRVDQETFRTFRMRNEAFDDAIFNYILKDPDDPDSPIIKIWNSHELIGCGRSFTIGTTFFFRTPFLVEEAKLYMLPPDISTEERGSYLNDMTARITAVTAKFFSENVIVDGFPAAGLKEVKFYPGDEIVKWMLDSSYERKPIVPNPAGALEEDMFSVFTAKTSFRPSNGYLIEITTNQTTGVVEIQGIETKIKI